MEVACEYADVLLRPTFILTLQYRTPMYQILQHALALPADKTKFTLIFANVSEADILLRETFDSWAKKHNDR